MTPFHPGSCEGVKRNWHAALGTLAAGAALYNLIAWSLRRERHLAINTLVYGALTCLEVRQWEKHR